MDRDGVLAWVRGYEDAWRSGDVDALPRLFGPDVSYRRSPFHEPSVGLDELAGFWGEDVGMTFTVEASIVAVDGDDAVARLHVRYATEEFRDLWVLHFDGHGRVDEFEEWPFSPEE